MNYPVPFIALLTLGSKFFAKKYNNNRWSLACLLGAFFASTVVFYAGFAHLVPYNTFMIITCVPLFNLFVARAIDYFGCPTVLKIIVLVFINMSAGSFFLAAGYLKCIQACWGLSLISSVVETVNTNYINPFERSEKEKKHEYSV